MTDKKEQAAVTDMKPPVPLLTTQRRTYRALRCVRTYSHRNPSTTNMGKFTATVRYLNGEITITDDEFLEVHEAMAGIAELNSDFRLLSSKYEIPASQIIPSYRNVKGDKYWGVADAVSGKKIDYGEFKEPKTCIPVYPKGEKGYYDYKDPANAPRKDESSRAPTGENTGAPRDSQVY